MRSEETVRNENPTSSVNFNVIMLRSPIGRLALDVLQECYVELSTTVGLLHVRYRCTASSSRAYLDYSTSTPYKALLEYDTTFHPV